MISAQAKVHCTPTINLVLMFVVQTTGSIPAKPSSDVNVVTVTVATLVAVLLTSNIFLFIMGCVCGHYICKQLIKKDADSSHPDPDHENLQLKTMKNDEQELELEQNVAYGHFWPENATGD